MTQESNPKQRTILFQSHTHQFSGGGERSSIAIIHDLIARGHQVHVLVPRRGPYQNEAARAGAKVHTVRSYWWTNNNLNEHQPKRNLIAAHKIIRLIQRIKPDVCLSNTIVNPWLGYSAYITGTAHAWIIREFGDTDHGLDFWVPKDRICRMIDDLSEKVFTSSEALRKHFQPLIPNNNIELVLPSVTTPKPSSSENPFSTDVIKLVCVGSLSPGKGQLDAVKAVERLIVMGHDTELMLIGPIADQSYADELTKYIATHDLAGSVKIVGQIENPADFIQFADISLVCSRAEAFGRVTVESMLLGKPVIGTNTAGTKEILGGVSNGQLLYEPGDFEQLSDIVIGLYKDKDRLLTIGSELRSIASLKYDPSKTHSALLSFVEDSHKIKIPRGSYRPLEAILQSQKQQRNKLKVRSKIASAKRRLNIFGKHS